MKKQTLVYALLFLTSCTQNSSNLTPTPDNLLEDPFYLDQIVKLDRVRIIQEKAPLQELLKENKITKENNGTIPIIIKVKRGSARSAAPTDLSSLPVLDENGDPLVKPVHKKRQLEEYFVKTDAVSMSGLETGTIIDLSDLENIEPEPNNTRFYKADWDGRSIAEKYTAYTVAALEKYGDKLLDPKAKVLKYRRYCRSYNDLEREERKRFWLMMISGLSRLESGFSSRTKYTESFKASPADDKNIVSRGLMQLSMKSIKSRSYKCHTKLGIKTADDLHDPEKNLACAVIILNHWIQTDKKMYGFNWSTCKDRSGGGCRTWYGAARYWGPIRTERYDDKVLSESQSERHEERLDLGRKTNDLNFCK